MQVLPIQNCTMFDSNDYGIRVDDGSPIISMNMIDGNSGSNGGIWIQAGNPNITGNTIQNSTGTSSAGIWIDTQDIPAIDGNTFSNNTRDIQAHPMNLDDQYYDNNGLSKIHVTSGNITSNTTWHEPILPEDWVYQLVFPGDITVDAGVTLTLEKGVEIVFANNSQNMFIDGALNAIGDAANPIIMRDNFATVELRNGSGPHTIDYLEMNTMGAFNVAALIVSTSDATITNSDFIDCEVGITVNNDASPSIQNSTFFNFADYGIQVSSGSPTITNVMIDGNGGVNGGMRIIGGTPEITGSAIQNTNGTNGGIWIETAVVPFIEGNTFINNNRDILAHPEILDDKNFDDNGLTEIHIYNTNVTANSTWHRSNEGWLYEMTGAITVNNGVTLDIEPGVDIRFTHQSQNLLINGTLIADGTPSSTIDFSNSGPSIFLNSSSTGSFLDHVNATSLGSFNEAALVIASDAIVTNSQFTGCEVGIRVANGVSPVIDNVTFLDSNDYGVKIDDGSPVISNSLIDGFGGGFSGILLTNGTPSITNSTFQNHPGGNGIHIDNPVVPTLDNNSFTGNLRDVLAHPMILDDANFDNNGLNVIHIDNDVVSGNATWHQPQPPESWIYATSGALSVNAGVTLTVEPGVTVQFSANSNDLTINGTLLAQGTMADPIKFKDNGATIFFTGTSVASVVDHTQLSDLGVFNGPAIDVSSSGVTITNSVFTDNEVGIQINNVMPTIQDVSISDSNDFGILVTEGSPTITNSSIFNNPTGINNTGAGTVMAANNWWGDISGPSHATNPSGTGDAVSDGVDFMPFLTATPGQLNLLGSIPAANVTQVASNANLILNFDKAVDQSSVDNNTTLDPTDDNIIITGSQSGLIAGTFSGDGSLSITFDPDNFFKLGETITVTVTNGVQGSGGEVAQPHSFSFVTAVGIGTTNFPGGEQVISSIADAAQSVYALDIDTDGDVDVFSASFFDNKIAWYENDGSQSFTEHVVSTNAMGANFIHLADVNSDGEIDILSASSTDDKIAWYENNGSQVFTERVVTTSADGANGVYAADINRDGHMDILSSSSQDDKISWYENDGSEVFTERVVTTLADFAEAVIAADVDTDGDVDILAASSVDNTVAWYENDGSENFTERIITSGALGARSVFAIDMEGDGDIDVLSASFTDNQIVWYENNGSQVFTPHSISSNAQTAAWVSALDMDGDGDVDVLSASPGDNKVALYLNNGSQSFSERIITSAADGVFSVYPVDMDADGDIDVLGALSNGDKVAWYAQGQAPFITTWKTDNPGTSGTNQITIPTFGLGFNYDIYWEEVGMPANNGTEPSGQTGDYTITFPSPGTYRIEISGDFPYIFFNSGGDREKILTIEQWGDISWSVFDRAFASCVNLTYNATDVPDLSAVTNLSSMFSNATAFNGDIGNWDVSTITTMNSMFQNADAFNQDISGWDVSSVTDMFGLFSSANVFNQDIGGWDVSKVTNMQRMFTGASVFNQDISGWDVSAVTTMQSMFEQADAFNQPIGSWDVSNVTTMREMFDGADQFNQDLSNWNVISLNNANRMFAATPFNQPLNAWNVSNVTNMSCMFCFTSAFNQDISGWDVGSVTTMNTMFQQADAFNQDLNSWDVSKVQDFFRMFISTDIFNGDISNWDVTGATDMTQMFTGALAFNGDITAWDVSNVQTMSGMFEGAPVFNQDISGWDVSNVTDMGGPAAAAFEGGMFRSALAFDQDLSSWDVSNVTDMEEMFDGSGLSVDNYDAALIGWSQLALQPNVTFGADGINFCAGESARDDIINNFSWTILDAGRQCVNNALDFDAVDDYVAIPHNAAYDTNPLSIEFWFRKNTDFNEDTPNAGDGESLIVKNETFSSTGSAFQFGLSGLTSPFELNFTVGNGSSSVILIHQVQPMIWYHVTGVINGSIIELYVDGVLIDQQDLGAPPIFNTAIIGVANRSIQPGISERYFNGKMDELRIWSKALTPTDIQANIFNELVGNETNLIGYYSFNQGMPAGTNTGINVLPDLSSTGNNGTLNNLALTGASSNWVTSGALQDLPGVPSKVLAVTSGSTQIDLSWNDQSFFETGHIIERSDGDNSNFVVVGNVGPDSESYSDNAVSPNSNYYYRITADGPNGDSPPSLEEFAGTHGPPGHALHFDGSNDGIDLGDPRSFQFQNKDFTMEGWFYFDGNPQLGTLIVKRNPLSPFEQYQVRISDGSFNTAAAGTQLTVFLLPTGRSGSGSEEAVDRFLTSGNLSSGWHHFAVVNDYDTDARLYINGVLTDTDNSDYSGGTLSIFDENLYIGRLDDGTRVFDGKMDEFRFWAVARSEIEIQNNMSIELNGNEPGLVAYYPFNQGVADGNNTTPAVDVLEDKSDNSNSGSLSNFALTGTTSNWTSSTAFGVPDQFNVSNASVDGLTIAYIPFPGAVDMILEVDDNMDFSSPVVSGASLGISGSGSVSTSLTQGITYYYRLTADLGTITTQFSETENFMVTPGNALDFDGVDDFVSIPDAPELQFGNGDFTFEAWFYFDGSSQIGGIMSKRNPVTPFEQISMLVTDGIFNGGAGKRIFVETLPDGRTFSGMDPGPNDRFVASSSDLTIGWHHVALVQDYDMGLTLYVDGVNEGSSNVDHGGLTFNISGQPLNIGNTNTLGWLDAQIDEVRVWNTARTENEIANTLFKRLVGNEPGLVAYYNFDHGAPGGNNAGETNLDDFGPYALDGTLSNFALAGPTSNWITSAAQAPFILPATAVSDNSFRANWVPVVGATNIEVEVDDDADFSSPITTAFVPTGGSAGIFVSLAPGTFYYYRLRADMGGSFTPFSKGQSFIIPPGYAIELDGVDDVITAPDANVLDFGTGDFTVEIWVNKLAPTSGFFNTYAISKWKNHGVNTGENEWTLTMATGSDDDLPAFGIEEGSVFYSVSSPDPIPIGEWHHLAGVREGTELRIYMDGQLKGATSIPMGTSVNNVGRNLSIGHSEQALIHFSNAQFDEARVWNVARSETDIKSDMFIVLDGNEPGLVAYYQFDEMGVSNTILPDLTPNNLSGTWTGIGSGVTNPVWLASEAFAIAPLNASDLITTEVTSNQIDLNWTDNSFNETGFKIQRSEGDNTGFTDLTTVGPDITSYSDMGLTPETGYYYRIVATNVSGDAGPSNEKFGSTISPPGNALSFDGTDDIVNIGDVDQLDGATTFTIETWIKRTGDGFFSNIVGKTVDATHHIQLGIPANAGVPDAECSGGGCGAEDLAFRVIDGGVDNIFGFTTTSPLTLNEWVHVAAIYDGNGATNADKLKIFVDGLPETLGFTPGTVPSVGPDNAAPLTLSANPFYLFAELDELRIWSTARGQSDIQSSQYVTLQGNEPNLVAYYRFDQGDAGQPNPTNTLLPDRSVNNNNGTLSNFALLDNTGSNWLASGAPLVTAGVITADETALIDFYNALNGPNWTDNSNWLSGDPSGWFGITTANNRVTAINLSGNNLAGDTPASFASLTGLMTVDVSGNDISTFPDISGLPVISSAELSDNQLQFGSLESNFNVTGIVYSPQQVALQEIDNLGEVNTQIDITGTLTGNNNEYRWFKDGVEIAGETNSVLTFTSAQFTDEGTYHAEVTNSNDPGDANGNTLTITTANYILKISSLARDRIALTNIYNATGGTDWTDNTDWLGDDLSTWFGVTVANNRVTQLQLPANNLQGNMPIDLKDIGQIELIDLQDNELRELPDVSSLIPKQLTTLNVTGNRLGFGDIEPNLEITSFSFDPQRRFGVTLDETVQVNDDFAVTIDISGDNNVYQWFRKPRGTPEDVAGTAVDGATAATYIIEDINFDNMGIYYVEVTSSLDHPKLEGFSIRNRNQNVFAVTDIFGTVFLNKSTDIRMGDGDVLLYEITAPGQPYDLLGETTLDAQGSYSFADAILGNYIILGRPGPTHIEDVLQTYYVSTNDWIFANTLQLRDVVQGIDIEMLEEPVPFDPNLGDGTVLGIVESDFPDPVDPEAGLREDARRRVRRAGCSLLRSRAKNRILQDTLVLVAYTETDENGEFSFGDIPPGDYLLNIQIPGVPMDTTNLIEFIVEEGKTNQVFNVEALALPDAIRLTLIEETGIWKDYFNNIRVYPNPVSDMLSVEYDAKTPGIGMRLVDVSGQLIQSLPLEHITSNRIHLDLSRLERGIYILNIVDEQKSDLSIRSYRILVE